MTPPDVPVFVISRQFAASPERVHDAWADPAKMAQWSGPKGSSVEIVSGSQAAGGWGGSFDKLDEWLAEEGVDPSCSA